MIWILRASCLSLKAMEGHQAPQWYRSQSPTKPHSLLRDHNLFTFIYEIAHRAHGAGPEADIWWKGAWRTCTSMCIPKWFLPYLMDLNPLLTGWKKLWKGKSLRLFHCFLYKTSNPEWCYNRQPSDPRKFRYFPFIFFPSHSPQYSSSLPGMEGPVYGPIIRGKEAGNCFQEEYFNS